MIITTNNYEWYKEQQLVTTSNEWRQVAASDSEWQRVAILFRVPFLPGVGMNILKTESWFPITLEDTANNGSRGIQHL